MLMEESVRFALENISEIVLFFDSEGKITYANKLAQKALEYEDVVYEMKQGYQGWEYKFNTVASSRGDYPFITITFGLGTGKWEKLASKTFLEVHRKGQGKKGNKKPVLFPKLVFLYTDDLHGEGKVLKSVITNLQTL